MRLQCRFSELRNVAVIFCNVPFHRQTKIVIFCYLWFIVRNDNDDLIYDIIIGDNVLIRIASNVFTLLVLYVILFLFVMGPIVTRQHGVGGV